MVYIEVRYYNNTYDKCCFRKKLNQPIGYRKS